MKTINYFRSVKRVILMAAFSSVFFPVLLCGQTKQKLIECIPDKLPSRLLLREDKPVKYKVITDYFNQDMFGNFFNKNRVIGQYTRGLGNNKVQWNNVRIAGATKKDEVFPDGARQDYMENFRYNPSVNITDTSFFKDFPKTTIYGKTLVWDMFAFENFAWLHFDSLQLNIPYHARVYNKNVSLGGLGNFINTDVKLIWTGMSKINGKLCALIQFEAMENLLTIKMLNMNARGRSHYWGNIWVALEDKQLEEAWMNEDVLLEIVLSADNKQFINSIRKLTVEKIKE